MSCCSSTGGVADEGTVGSDLQELQSDAWNGLTLKQLVQVLFESSISFFMFTYFKSINCQ